MCNIQTFFKIYFDILMFHVNLLTDLKRASPATSYRATPPDQKEHPGVRINFCAVHYMLFVYHTYLHNGGITMSILQCI